MIAVVNVLVSALVIAAAAWLSGRYPTAAGFLIAVPLATMLVLPMSYVQHGDAADTYHFARSIVVAVPLSLTFFLPFLLAPRMGWSFWATYAAGCALLPLAYLAHGAALRWWSGTG